jgi:hypothetical protein
MIDFAVVEWQGSSGKTYLYASAPFGTELPDEAGNYIFARQDGGDTWTPLYVGEAVSLSVRVDREHERYQCFLAREGTHVHWHTNWLGDNARVEEKADLIARWLPACND